MLVREEGGSVTYYTKADEAANAFFREAARSEGLSYNDWCKKYGILSPSGLERIEQHEISREAMVEEKIAARFVSPHERDDAYKSARTPRIGREDRKVDPHASPSTDAAEAAD